MPNAQDMVTYLCEYPFSTGISFYPNFSNCPKRQSRVLGYSIINSTQWHSKSTPNPSKWIENQSNDYTSKYFEMYIPYILLYLTNINSSFYFRWFYSWLKAKKALVSFWRSYRVIQRLSNWWFTTSSPSFWAIFDQYSFRKASEPW